MDATNPGPAASTPGVVTQAQLARFKELEPLAYEFRALQERLRAVLDEGAEVEDGEFVVDFYVTEEQRVTAKKLIAALGLTHKQVSALAGQMPPTRVRHLGVYAAAAEGEGERQRQSE